MTRRYCEPPQGGLRALVAIRGITNLHEQPSWESTIETQVLFGETLIAHAYVGRWIDASMNFGGFWHRGFVHSSEVADVPDAATHKVQTPWTPLRPLFRHRGTPIDMLARDSLLVVLEETDDHVRVWPAGWVFKNHVCPIGNFKSNPLEEMKSMIGTPFLWGGRSAFSVDCAGLIQSAFGLCGISTPRASTDLAATFGVQLPDDEPTRPGDLIFYSEHCGVLLNDNQVLHSNGKVGHVLVEDRATLHRRMTEKFGYTLMPRRRFEGSRSVADVPAAE